MAANFKANALIKQFKVRADGGFITYNFPYFSVRDSSFLIRVGMVFKDSATEWSGLIIKQ
jgi:hypothetical protein